MCAGGLREGDNESNRAHSVRPYWYKMLIKNSTIWILLLPLMAFAALPEKEIRGDVFTIGRVKYAGGGDWYGNPSSLPKILSRFSGRKLMT